MQITGIDGTYRCTCESVMKVLRHNKDSLMAVLEAFVYDPLLNWRLIDNANSTKAAKRTKTPVVGNNTQADISVSPLRNRAPSDAGEVSLGTTSATAAQMPSSVKKAPESGKWFGITICLCHVRNVKFLSLF